MTFIRTCLLNVILPHGRYEQSWLARRGSSITAIFYRQPEDEGRCW